METLKQLTLIDLSELTSLPAASPVSRSVLPENSRPKTTNAGYGPNLPAPFAHYHRVSSSWKTFQACLFGDLETFSATWPRSGMMRNGMCYRQPPLVRRISETASCWLPTPTATDKGGGRVNKSLSKGAKPRPTLSLMARKGLWPTPTTRDNRPTSKASQDRYSAGPTLGQVIGGKLNPMWVEWLMGFPPGWTEYEF